MDNNKLRNTLHKRPWYYHSSEESGHGIKQVNEYCKEGSQKKGRKTTSREIQPDDKTPFITREHEVPQEPGVCVVHCGTRPSELSLIAAEQQQNSSGPVKISTGR